MKNKQDEQQQRVSHGRAQNHQPYHHLEAELTKTVMNKSTSMSHKNNSISADDMRGVRVSCVSAQASTQARERVFFFGNIDPAEMQ